jgi:phage terminase large subunit GpA-like protein
MDTQQQTDIIFKSIRSFLAKDILPEVSEWAEKNRFMTSKVSNITGQFSYQNTPYAREIADCFSKNSPIKEIAIMKGVQLGFTTAIFENVIGYSIAHDPSPMMLVSGDLKLLKDFKTIKIDNLIDNSNLRDKIIAETDNKHSRRTGDTAEMIDFLGGFLRIAGCHNANSLRSLPIKKLFLDELDAYPKTLAGEGSPIDLAVKRTESYSRTRKIGYISTPLLNNSSSIKEYFEKGDQRKFFVPCPSCNKKQELIFYSKDGGEYSDDKVIAIDNEQLTKDNYKKNSNNSVSEANTNSTVNCQLSTVNLAKPYGLIFNSAECKEGNYSSVVYRCKYCGNDMKDYHKKKILQYGEWMPTAKAKKPHYRSYHLSTLYSLFKTWEDCVADFLDAGTDPVKLQSFYNLTLGLPFEETIAGVELYRVRNLREEHRPNNTVPNEALFLIGACDIQDDRLEIEIKAFGDRWRSWGIDHRIIKGNTSDPIDNCWNILYEIKDELFYNENNTTGTLIRAILIDSGDGEKTDLVYKFCERDEERVFIPIKGISSSALNNKKFNLKPLDGYNDLYLIEIYVSLYKNQIARFLNSEWRQNEPYPYGYMTFAKDYTEEYFRQLTTERRIKEKLENGSIIIRWEQHGRNEAFDLCVYCLCGAEFLISELVKTGQCGNGKEAFALLQKQQCN